MINLLKKTCVALIGAASLPLIITISKAFYLQLANIYVVDSRNQLYFLWGLAAYVAMHLFFFKPNFLYNLGHETVHVLTTWASFGKAKKMKVSAEGGSVQTTKSNFFISISPYFVPLYTTLLCLAYFIISKFRDISVYAPYFVFFIGFTFTMHIIMTVEALKTAQPDLIKTGYLFSLSLIYLANLIVAGFIISLIFPGFSFIDMVLQFCVDTKALYILLFRQLFAVG